MRNPTSMCKHIASVGVAKERLVSDAS